MKINDNILNKLTKDISIPAALINSSGKIISSNKNLSLFLKESVKEGENLISLLKKKALK
jgi:hypothetical protein